MFCFQKYEETLVYSMFSKLLAIETIVFSNFPKLLAVETAVYSMPRKLLAAATHSAGNRRRATALFVTVLVHTHVVYLVAKCLVLESTWKRGNEHS